MSWLFVRNVRA